MSGMDLGALDIGDCGPATLTGEILPAADPLPIREPALTRSEAELRDRREIHPLPTGQLVDLLFDPTLRRDHDQYGFRHGTPLDRIYIHDMLMRFAPLLGGHVGVVDEPGYALALSNLPKLGRPVTATTAFDVDPDNPRADMVADLGQRGSLPAQTFDSVLCFQTLHYLPVGQVPIALENLAESLTPGGAALITVPATGPLDGLWPQDRQRWFARGFHEELTRTLDERFSATTLSYGNRQVVAASRWPLTFEDIEDRLLLELEGAPDARQQARKQAHRLVMHNDRNDPLTIGAVIKRRVER